MKKILLIILALVCIISCNSDDEVVITVEATDFEITIDENVPNNQVLGTIEATTNQGNLIFSIEEQTPSDAFTVNESTGELTVLDNTLFDYELNPVLTGIVKVSNGDIFALSQIEITLNDVNEVVITVEATDFEITIDENVPNNQVLGIIEATTNQGNLIFSIEEQTPSDAFTVNESTGELTVLDNTLFDYELNPVLTGIVKVSNGDIFALSQIEITLNDVYEVVITVEATDFEITVNEDIPKFQVLGIVEASTNQGELNFTIEEQYPEGALRIDYHTGEISVANRNSFDYELYPIISGIVNVSNGNVSTSASITINLLDVAYNNTKFKGTDFIIIDDSAFNVPEIDFTNYMVDMIYEDNILERISYASHPNLNRYTGNIQINEINNNLITNFSEREFFHGFGCRANYTLTYDSFDRITNILVQVDICDSFTYNYNIEYIGNTVNFIDQINSNDKSMVLNDNNQILSYTSGSSTVDFTYDSNNNLISVLSGNKSITYEYDNYQNPYNFDGTFNLSLLINFSLVIQNNLSDEKMFNLYGNTNNITRIIRNNINDAMNVNYYYNYNEYNYPVSKTSDLFTETINYYYYD